MSVEAGTLNNRILIQRRILTQDDSGGVVINWENLFNDGNGKIAADIKYQSGSQTIKSSIPLGITRASIRTRLYRGVDITCRVVYRDYIFDILAVLPNESDSTYMDLICERGGNNG